MTQDKVASSLVTIIQEMEIYEVLKDDITALATM